MQIAWRGAPHPFSPSKIIGIGVNYRAHAAEMGKALPIEPLMFLKAPSALIGAGEAIVRPTGYARVDYEGELGVVIGTVCRNISVADALTVVRGFTCVNDVTVRELQARDGQWARAKGFDTFCPVGPVITEGLDPRSLSITTRVNGVVRQAGNTNDMVFGVADIIAFVSRHMTLYPGDLIATGTPAGVGNLDVGDVVDVEIEGIGLLSNQVVSA